MHKHASKKEAQRCDELTILERQGVIRWLKQQPKFTVQPGFRFESKAIREIVYIADFSYFDVETKKQVVEDTKGFKTKDYMIKKKMLLFMFKDRTDFQFLES
jgi:hypothetical protein